MGGRRAVPLNLIPSRSFSAQQEHGDFWHQEHMQMAAGLYIPTAGKQPSMTFAYGKQVCSMAICVSMPCSCLQNLPVLGIQVKSKWGERVFGWYDTLCVAYTKHPHLWSQQDLGYLQTINCFLWKDSMKHEGKKPTFLKSSSRFTLGWNVFLLHNSTVSCAGRDGIELEQFFI